MSLEAPTAEFKITSANRQAVKDWLAAQGFDATRVQSMRDQTLLKAYIDPRYLRALTNRGDYNPSVERTTACLSQPVAPQSPACVSSPQNGEPHTKSSASIAPPSARTDTAASSSPKPMAEAGLSSAPAGPENTQPLTEARVIELIRALAVLKPGLEGLEDLL